MTGYRVMVDGVTVKKFNTKREADAHASNINSQLLVYGNEAYVEEIEDEK